MKNIAIINSPVFKDKNSSNTEDYLPPIGLGIIASALEDRFNILFVDSIAENLGVNDIIKIIKSSKIQIVCLNIFATNYSIVRKIVEETRTEVHWIVGGISTRKLYAEIFEWETDNQIDIVYGDGELIVESIIDGSIAEKPRAFKDKRRFFVVTLYSRFYANDISIQNINRKLFKHEPQVNFYGEKEICVYTSRGCPYDCAYCAAAFHSNKELGGIRRKDATSIVLEINSIKELYPEATAIRIIDDLFLSSKNRFKDAIAIFSQYNYSWRAMCHINSIANIDDDVLKHIAESGCKELFVGIESGSCNVLKRIHKIFDIAVIVKSIERVLENGINVKGYFICGFPNETEEDLEKTFQLAKHLTELGVKNKGKFRNSTFQFRPYYGTELYDEIVSTHKLPYNSILTATKVSENLNNKVRKKAFNFDSGNYSSVSDELLQSYLKQMNDLNVYPIK